MAKLYVSNKDESARLFKSDLLEPFSHVHWSVPIILYVPVVAFFLYRASQTPEITTMSGTLIFLSGVFVWTLTEYLLHRFVFHYEPSSTWGKQLHFLMHGVHHDYPQDHTRLVMPPPVSIPLAAAFGLLFSALFGAHWEAIFAGFLVGYVIYDTTHYATHHWKMQGGLGRFLREYHLRHHFRDDDLGYGVSSPLWDYVFGTVSTRTRTDRQAA